jgi:hypothetical protein
MTDKIYMHQKCVYYIYHIIISQQRIFFKVFDTLFLFLAHCTKGTEKQ